MTTTMTPDLYVHQALKILGEGLEPHIRAVMAPHLGELEWIQVLRILDEAPILRSQATLFASRAAMGPAMDALIARLVPPQADWSA